ncbi:MAG: hypothetical protein QMD43_03235 [Thermodesulfovibrio sp.]|uniref:hypothetical protein n=1 Tax=unclassified Thermodesulfovibrio TaxID=2645936 RepID=UPI00083B8A2D|nr:MULTISPECIES: hypothetical protein [unclassified Thermodesulfovibrio]MDI1471172.1 hypothetical protein [Thermodesulfovibrio sp. 1176]MDI6714027.1 hypothetical protein [Thermodesulfovibrio sp.]ODA45031.1 hypothetical protein THER_0258 [Thermodesulfovibrio sp. N1]
MKVKFSISLTLLVIIALVVFSVSFVLAHDPSLTNHPGLSHIHVKGKITAPDGSPARLPSGAMIGGKSGEVFDLIAIECHANPNEVVTSPINPNTGEYEIIFYFKNHTERCREEFDVRPMWPERMRFINAPGYELKRAAR